MRYTIFMPSINSDYSRIMPRFEAKADPIGLKAFQFSCKKQTGKYDFNHIAPALRPRVTLKK